MHEVLCGSKNIGKNRERKVLAFKNVPYSNINALHLNNKAEKTKQKDIGSKIFCWH